MRRTRTRTIGLLAALSLVAAAPAATVEADSGPQAVTSKRCSSGYTHAVVPGGDHKCLRAGQICSRKASYQRVYKSKGFYCKPSRRLREN
jgi:hypothetical protein